MIGILSDFVRETFPSYLKNVPIPSSYKGFLDLSAKEWVHLIAFSGVVGIVSYYHVKPLIAKYKEIDTTKVNLNIQKSCDKVVNVMDVEDINEKACYCRCWRSKKFPYCDGSHNKHNEQSGDNVGPLIVKKSS